MTLTDVTGWIAPVATMIAAMMTAANLGARLTGWGFVVFSIGSVAWTMVGWSSGQTNLIASNGFLTIVNVIGIWRWLGRQRAYEDGGRAAEEASRRSKTPTLFTATGIAGMSVVDADGASLGKAVQALIECRSGTVSYVVIATSAAVGMDEQLRAVPSRAIAFGCDLLTLKLSRGEFDAIEPLSGSDWPASAEMPAAA